MAPLRIIALTIGATFALSSCGGGSGSGDGETATASVFPPETPHWNSSISPVQRVSKTIRLDATTIYNRFGLSVEFFVDGQYAGSDQGVVTDGKPPWVTYTFVFDSTFLSDGMHTIGVRSRDTVQRMSPTVNRLIYVENTIPSHVALVPAKIFPAPLSGAAGTGDLSFDAKTGLVGGEVTLTGMTATEVHIHVGHATATGMLVATLVQDGTSNRWKVPNGVVLASSQADLIPVGGLYIDAHSAAYPEGEIRDQILPSWLKVAFAPLRGDQVVPPVSTGASGVVALTGFASKVRNDRVRVDVNTIGVATTHSIGIYFGTVVPGAGGFALTRDGVTDHWYRTEFEPIMSAPYIAVVSPGFPNGELRGDLPMTEFAKASKLSELQTSIFTPKCSGCHDGSGTSLPGSLDLRSGKTHATLTATNAGVVPLRYVNSLGSDISYLLHKLEGVSTITGAPMPLGAPKLSRAELNAIASWIDAGALNN